MALIALAADKGAPGVTTTAVALAAVWPRAVLLAECDPAGGDLVYRRPSAQGSRLDPRRGLLSLAVAARRGLQPHQVWEHSQKLRGGLDVLVGVTNAEQGAGLDLLWGQVGAALSGLPDVDVIADCGRVGAEGRFYDLLGRADAVVLVTRASLGDMVRIRDRVAVLDAAVRRRSGAGRVCVLVVASYKNFSSALGEVKQVLSGADWPAPILGGIAYEPRSADLLSGEWGGKLDKSLLIRTARDIAGQLSAQMPAGIPASQHQPGLSVTGPPVPAPAAPAPPAPGPPAAARPAGDMRTPPLVSNPPAPPARQLPAPPVRPEWPPAGAGPYEPPPAHEPPPAERDYPPKGGRGRHAGPGGTVAAAEPGRW
jgi:hypothetical protein